MKVAIVVSSFHADIAEKLTKGALAAIPKADVINVPGAFEIPFACKKLLSKKKYDGMVALGCVIKGDTNHYEAVCLGVTYGIQKVALEKHVPIMFGVLMARTKKQALARCQTPPKLNKGYTCALALMDMLENPLLQ